MEFSGLSDRAQVHRLRSVAFRALERYPIDVRRVRLQEHGFNTTFRVDSLAGQSYALRIDVNRRKPLGALDAEMAWLAALARDTEITVPVPQATVDGSMHTPVWFEPLEKSLNVAVMSWLPGRDLETSTVESLHELGRLTALLHEHARNWHIPEGAEFPAVDSVFMDEPELVTSPHPLISTVQRAVFVETLATVRPRFDAMIAAGERMPIHGDLHGWNVKWLRGRMSIFDFDDAGIGVPAQDLTITTYYQEPDPALRRALLDGYESAAPLPPFTHDQFQAALAARSLLLLNSILDINTREIREMIPRFLHNVVVRSRAYLESGEFRPDVPGVVTLD